VSEEDIQRPTLVGIDPELGKFFIGIYAHEAWVDLLSKAIASMSRWDCDVRQSARHILTKLLEELCDQEIPATPEADRADRMFFMLYQLAVAARGAGRAKLLARIEDGLFELCVDIDSLLDEGGDGA